MKRKNTLKLLLTALVLGSLSYLSLVNVSQTDQYSDAIESGIEQNQPSLGTAQAGGQYEQSVPNDDALAAKAVGDTVAEVLKRAKSGENALEAARKSWTPVRTLTGVKQGRFLKTTFYQAVNFKYSTVRFDEAFDADPELVEGAKMIAQIGYVADHMLVKISPEQRGLVEGILKKFPALEIRKELATDEHVLVSFPIEEENMDHFAYWSARFSAHGLVAEKDKLTFALATAPFDPKYELQYSLDNTGQTGGTADADIDADLAWDIQTGSENVIVAVIDTGVDLSHQDLIGNLWSTTTGGNNIIRGANFVEGGNFPQDVDGHGTHVAGILGAQADNARGIAGVAWNVSIMPIKVLNDFGVGTVSDVISGIDFAIANGASIMNLSLGTSGVGDNSNDDSFYAKLRQARDQGTKGVLVVAAAGNDGLNADISPSFPAAYDLSNIISVASSDHNDDLVTSSNFGVLSVDLAAPGDAILSLLPGNQTGILGGTSMAAPHVAGVAALIVSEDSNLDYLEIKNLILNTVDQKDAFKGKTLTGGRLNANNALLSFNGSNVLITNLNTNPLGGVNNGDEFLTVGENLLVDVEISNLGNAAATNVNVILTISQGDTFATIIGPDTKAIGGMGAGQVLFLDDAFELSADALGAFDFEQVVEIRVEVTSDPATSNVRFTTYEIYQSASLSGVILDGSDGVTPIEGALVEIRADLPVGIVELSQVTAADGSYSFDLFTGTVLITASANGYIDSLARVIELSPNKANQVQDIELGRGDFVVLTPEIDITVPAGETRNVEARIQNTGSTPVPLFFSLDVSGTGEFFGGDQLYGMKDVGTINPKIVLMNRFNLTADDEISITLPAGRFAIDFCYFNGNIWILTSNTNGTASLFAFDDATFELVDTVNDLTVVNDSIRSTENVFVVSIPNPTPDDADASTQFLAIAAMNDLFFNPRIYRILPDAVERKDITDIIAEVDDNSISFFSSFDQLAFAGGNERGSFFYGRGLSLDEWEVTGPKAVSDLTELNLFDFDPNFNFFLEDLTFPLRDIRSMTYFSADGALFVMTTSPVDNILKLDFDGVSLSDVFTGPAGVTRLTSGSAQNINWLELGYFSGSIARGNTVTLPLDLIAAGLGGGASREAFIRVQSPVSGTVAFINVVMTVGDLSTDPEFTAWYQRSFGMDPTAASADSDADMDGIAAAIEYVIGGDPLVSNSGEGLPSVVLDPDTGNIFVKFNRRAGLADGFFEIRGAATMSDPFVTLIEGIDFEVVSINEVNNEIDQITISTAFNGSAFFQLRITP